MFESGYGSTLCKDLQELPEELFDELEAERMQEWEARASANGTVGECVAKLLDTDREKSASAKLDAFAAYEKSRRELEAFTESLSGKYEKIEKDIPTIRSAG